MKLMPLHKIVAPSPSVLNFLRTQVQYAFDSPRAQCAALKGQRCAYGMASRVARGDKLGIKDGRGAATGLQSVVPSGCMIERTAFQSSRMTRLNQPSPRTSLFASNQPAQLFPGTFSSHRTFTTTSPRKAWQLFGGGKGRQSARLQPPLPFKDTIDTPVGFDSLGRMTRAANELKMRCTELDEQGNVTMVSGEFKKSELIARVRSHFTSS
jgi:magnesium transporter